MNSFRERYGPWAVVAGASEGLGLSFATVLAERKINLVLLARRANVLEKVASQFRAAHGIDVETMSCDLSDASFGDRLRSIANEREISLGVYNAAYSSIGNTFEAPLANALRVVDVNCRGPLVFAHALVPKMIARGHGGLVLMSSLAGFHGGPRLATYAASKAFNLVLGEGLWSELRPKGIDVLVSCPGATRTPNYLKTMKKEAPGTLDARVVAERTLNALGHGPHFVPGAVNSLASFFLDRLVSRKMAVSIMAKSTADLHEVD